ncbi:hypothetical protein AAC387_Pa08g2635 [Persea americana]
MSRSCPPNSFVFNSTLCHCKPGYLLEASKNSCELFNVSQGEWAVSYGVDYRPIFFETLFSFDTIRKFTQSQAVFLEATLVAILSWLLFCAAVRFGRLDEGRSVWFQIRWWISRWDFCFATRHWLEDQKVVRKRKTELGGTFSVASSILFIGLFSALLYQILTKRTVEVHNVKPTNAPDLLSFVNDMDFNITAVSSMTCSHLRSLGTLVIGSPGSIDYRVSPLSIFANYTCQNTSMGPTINLKCNSCRVPRDNFFVSWQFVDLPNNPVTAVGFEFNLTTKKHGDSKHVSFVSGKLKSDSIVDDKPYTFRGSDVNILKFHLFPRIYRNFNNLSLIQPLFHEFVPGSSFFDTSKLQASLQSSKDGLINTTVHVNFISDYIIEINNESILGPVGFLADLGGLYAVSFIIFLFLLLQCERRVKRLRNEDSVLRNIRSRKRAQLHWDKLRKYVMYTWGCELLEEEGKVTMKQLSRRSMRTDSLCGIGSLHKRKQLNRTDSISFEKKNNVGVEMNIIPAAAQWQRVKSCLPESATSSGRDFPYSDGEHVSRHALRSIGKEGHKPNSSSSYKADMSQSQEVLLDNDRYQLAPVPEFTIDRGADIADMKNLQNLYDYNVHLRERFMTVQSLLEDLLQKTSHAQQSTELCGEKG